MATKHQKIFLCIFSMVLKNFCALLVFNWQKYVPKKETIAFKPHHQKNKQNRKTPQQKNKAKAKTKNRA